MKEKLNVDLSSISGSENQYFCNDIGLEPVDIDIIGVSEGKIFDDFVFPRLANDRPIDIETLDGMTPEPANLIPIKINNKINVNLCTEEEEIPRVK